MNVQSNIQPSQNDACEWRQVEGFPDYSVSSDGEIRGKGRWGEQKVLRKFFMKGRAPYAYVNLYRDGKMSTRRVSVVVCETFYGPRPSSAHEAAHGNGIHDDDRAENLRWATRHENAADRKLHGTQVCGVKANLAKLTEDAVREIRRCPARYGVVVELARKFGVHPHTISEVRLGRTWSHVS